MNLKGFGGLPPGLSTVASSRYSWFNFGKNLFLPLVSFTLTLILSFNYQPLHEDVTALPGYTLMRCRWLRQLVLLFVFNLFFCWGSTLVSACFTPSFTWRCHCPTRVCTHALPLAPGNWFFVFLGRPVSSSGGPPKFRLFTRFGFSFWREIHATIC